MGDLKNEFSWSVSRDSMFNECKRRYYYYYYGSWGGWEKSKADDVTRTLYVLKQLKSRWQWKGIVVHNEIARILKQLVSTGKLIPIETSLTRVTDLMRQDFIFSKDGSYWEKDWSLRSMTALFEHEYKINIPAENWKRNHEDVQECIRNFYRSDILDKVKHLEKKMVLSIDRIAPIPFLINNEKIYVNLDLAYCTEEKVEIVDWKTGDGESSPLQFVVYTIYTNEVLATPLERISVIEYNLLANQKTTHKFSPDKIEGARDYIIKSIAIMKGCLQDSTENIAFIRNFPRTEDERRCGFCNFKKICFDLP